MSCVCASAIVAEMADWVRLGGGNSGCCGNAAHTYGFHCPANRLPTSDYSRRHEKAGPCSMGWACAGDFAHNGKAALRARHAKVLAGLMAGRYPMICEFIGQPWAGRPVYYWCRWAGIKTLQRYTGAGHTTWSHISWWRSRADERARLWIPAPAPKPRLPLTPVPGKVVPKYPGYVMRRNPTHYDANVRIWQAQMRSRGWTVDADGYFGDKTVSVVKAFQAEKKITADGLIGTATWIAAWKATITRLAPSG